MELPPLVPQGAWGSAYLSVYKEWGTKSRRHLYFQAAATRVPTSLNFRISCQFFREIIMNYADLLQTKAAMYGDKPFLIWGGTLISYTDMLERARQISLRIGSKMGHRLIGIRSASPVSQLAAFLGIEMAGAVPVILHEFLKGEKLRLFLEQSPVSFLLEEKDGDWTGKPCAGDVVPEAVSMGVLTSGTSGMPKVHFRTYESWADFFPEQNRIFEIDDTSRVYIQGSFGFTGNLSIVMGALAAGAAIIGTSALRPRMWMEDMQKARATHIYMIPSKLSALVRTDGTAENVRMILAGSQLMTDALLQKLKKHFPKSRVLLYYGASETSYVSYLMDDELPSHPGSVGRPFPGVHVTEKGGELYVTTSGLIYGKSSPFGTGDLGTIESDGFITFHGRKSDVYNIKGNHVSKAELVRVLKAIDFIHDADILPFTTESGEIKLAAFLTADKENREAVLAHLRAHLQPWEIPAKLFFLKEIPVTSTGKTDYSFLRGILGGECAVKIRNEE